MEDDTMIAYSFYSLIEDRLKQSHQTLREAYRSYKPADSAMLDHLDKKTTIVDLWSELVKSSDERFYAMCNYDSIVRESVLNAFASATSLPYDFFYYLWLGNETKAFETLYSENSIGKLRTIEDEGNN